MSYSDGIRLLSCRSGWAVGLFLFLCGTAKADEDLNTLRTAHRSARGSIRTLSAKVTSEIIVPKKKRLLESRYWRSRDTVRIHAELSSGSIDLLVKGSEIHRVSISRRTGRREYAAGRESRGNLMGGADAWAQMLMEIYRPNGGQVDLDRFLSLAKEPPRISRERLNGVPCWRVRMSIESPGQGEFHYVLWHDVTHNYLIRKIEITTSSDPNYHFETEITEFLEATPGIFVPTRCVHRTRRGDYHSEDTTTLSEVRVNAPIPYRIFALPAIPRGTLLKDRIKGTTYSIDSQWQRTGPEQPLVTLRVAPPAPEDRTEYHAQSVREPRSATWWLIPGSLVLLACTGAVWGYRRYRRRQEDD